MTFILPPNLKLIIVQFRQRKKKITNKNSLESGFSHPMLRYSMYKLSNIISKGEFMDPNLLQCDTLVAVLLLVTVA